MYVAPDAPVKFAVLTVHNDSGRLRKLSATGCVEWVLGDLPEKGRMHVVTEIDASSGVLLAGLTICLMAIARLRRNR